MKIPRWAQVLIGIGIVMVFLGIGAIVAITAYFSENVAVTASTAGEAEDEFEKVRQRFKGKPPLVTMHEGERVATSTIADAPAGQQTLHTLHVLAWDVNEEKLANVNIPWWVVRMKSGPLRFSTYASGLDDRDLKLTAEQIERHGPGIILELTGRHGERVLLWAD